MSELSNIEKQDPKNSPKPLYKLPLEAVSSVTTPTDDDFKFSEKPTLEELRSIQSKFVTDRNWKQFQAPRNLLLAMVAEVGELAEIFQWKGECKPGLPEWPQNEREHLEQELSDVFIYLIRLAEECHVDLPAAAAAKIERNKLKYPVEKFFGTSKKYNE